MRGTQPIIAGFEDGGREPFAKEHRQPLKANGPQLIARRKQGALSYNHREMNSANNLNDKEQIVP